LLEEEERKRKKKKKKKSPAQSVAVSKSSPWRGGRVDTTGSIEVSGDK
jgi:hypothetical protein